MIPASSSAKPALRRILITSEVRGDTRRYRALHLLEQLRLCGVHVQFAHLMNVNFDRIARQPWDMVVFHRVAYRDFLEPYLKWFRESGAMIISDFDDLIYDPDMFKYINSPDFADPVRAKLYIENMHNIRLMLELSEGVIASTNYLQDQIQQLGKPVWIHRNAFSLEMLASSEQALKQAKNHAPDRVVIGYASGTPTHNRDFELIRPVLHRVLARYPQAELNLVGPLDPGNDWGELGVRIRRIPLVPWRKLPELLYQFDINLAPLVMDNPFAQSKSEIKYMEAAMVAVPTIASATDAFCYAIHPNENGFLAKDEAEWEDHLSRLVENSQLRKNVGTASRATVMAEYHPTVRASQLSRQLESIGQTLRGASFWTGAFPAQTEMDKRARQAIVDRGFVSSRYENEPTNLQMGLFSLRTAGFKTTLQRLWIFVRRLVAPIFPFKSQS